LAQAMWVQASAVEIEESPRSSAMAAEFGLLCSVGTPGTVGRLAKCCRAFRSIFTSDEIWKALCEDVVGKDVVWKDKATSWRMFYGDWCQSARAWFRAYTRLGRQIAERPSFGMRVEFLGTDLPAEWTDAAELRASSIDVADMGITGEVFLEWSDTDGFASLPRWTYSNTKRISRLRVLGGDAGDAASRRTFLEVDAGASRSGVLEFARSEVVECAGLSISHGCFCEGDEDICDKWGEHLELSVHIPMDRFLAAVLGADEARAAAAEYLGRSPSLASSPANPMLFAEVGGRDGDDVIASLSRVWPSPSWYNPRHAFDFRRSYAHAFDQWQQPAPGDAHPMPGYRFTFDFDQSAMTTKRFRSNLASLWCLDANGNTSFAQHRISCRVDSKFRCRFMEEPSVVITPESGCNFVLCELRGSEERADPAGGGDRVVELAALNILMLPFIQIKGFPDRSSLLSTVITDYTKRLLHRFVAYKMPDAAATSAADQWVSEFCQTDDADGLVRKFALCNFPDFDIISEDSDQEEERSFWEDHMARQQEKRIRELQDARWFSPGTVFSFDLATGASEERLRTEADRPKVSRVSPARSVWFRMSPLRRCERCRCILTGPPNGFADEGCIYRTRCCRCG